MRSQRNVVNTTKHKQPVKPVQYNTVHQEDEISGVKEQFGEKTYQHIINMRQDPRHLWEQTPRDVSVYIGKQKVSVSDT